MARLAFLSLLGLAFAGVCSATPFEQESLQASLGDALYWKDCGSPSDPIHIKSIEISPDPPRPDGAYVDVLVKVGVIKLLQKEFDLCEEARNAEMDIQCPVDKGTYNVSHTVTLHKEIPPAAFNINVRGFTDEDGPLVCLDLKIDFRTPRLW